VSPQSGQLFGYTLEAEDVVVRRVSRRVGRYIDQLKVLEAKGLLVSKVTAAPSGASPSDAFGELLAGSIEEFADDVPTLVSRTRGTESLASDADQASAPVLPPPLPDTVVPAIEAPVAFALERVQEPGPAETPALAPLQAPPPPKQRSTTPQGPKPLEVPPPPVRAAPTPKHSPKKVIEDRLKAPLKEPSLPPFSQPLSSLLGAGQAKDSPSLERSGPSPVAMLVVVIGLAALLGGVVYFLLTFNKFIY
jgi:hypothetical protein